MYVVVTVLCVCWLLFLSPFILFYAFGGSSATLSVLLVLYVSVRGDKRMYAKRTCGTTQTGEKPRSD